MNLRQKDRRGHCESVEDGQGNLMKAEGKTTRFNFRQIVPAEWCFSCDVCCRFPEKDSFLAPYFTKHEMESAIEGGIETLCFPDKAGCKITLIPYKEGFICPAFDPPAAQCKIYPIRPVDCMLYPFAILWDTAGKEVVLGIDTKCPYVRGYREDYRIKEAAVEIASAIESPPLLDILAANKGLIGPYQDDVIPLVALKTLTSRF